MSEDNKNDVCVIKQIANNVILGNLILPNASIINNIFHYNPTITKKELKCINIINNTEYINKLILNSVSKKENISDFLQVLNKDNWETVFYIVLLYSFGFEVNSSMIQNINNDFFNSLIENNSYIYVPQNIDIKTAQNNRYLLSIIYKEKISKYKISKSLYKDVINVICSFLPKYKLRNWLIGSPLEWETLWGNPNAIDMILEEGDMNNIGYLLSINPNERAIPIIEKYLDKIDWHLLCENPHAIHILEKELKRNPKSKRIDWRKLCRNPNAVHILEEEYKKNHDSDKLNWGALCENVNAIHLIEQELKRNPDNIFWYHLSHNPNALHILEEEIKRNIEQHMSQILSEICNNPNPGVIDLIKKLNLVHKVDRSMLFSNPNAIDLIKQNFNLKYLDIRAWAGLSQNINAIDILKENKKNVNWSSVCTNINAIDLIKEQYYINKHKLDWRLLCRNPNAINILEIEANQNNNLIQWFELSENPNIFEPTNINEINKLLLDVVF